MAAATSTKPSTSSQSSSSSFKDRLRSIDSQSNSFLKEYRVYTSAGAVLSVTTVVGKQIMFLCLFVFLSCVICWKQYENPHNFLFSFFLVDRLYFVCLFVFLAAPQTNIQTTARTHTHSIVFYRTKKSHFVFVGD